MGRGSARATSKPFHPLRGHGGQAVGSLASHTVSRWSRQHCSPISVKPGGRAPPSALSLWRYRERKTT